MKRTMVFCALLIGMGTYAQRGTQNHTRQGEERSQLTSEQRATLQSKRMTLTLGLNAQQQDQMAVLLKNHLDERTALRAQRKSEESAEQKKDRDRYTLLNQRLDREIAFQENLKGILSQEQFDAWKAHKEDRNAKRKQHHRQGKMRKHGRKRG